MEKNLKQAEAYISYIIIFLIPITFLPIFMNGFTTPKLFILTWGIGLILFLKTIKILGRGSLKISLGTFDIPVLFLAVAYLVSAFIQTPNKMEAFFLPGTATTVLCGILLYFILNQLDEIHKNNIRPILVSTATIASLISLLAISGIFKSISALPAFMKDTSFATADGSLSTFIFLVTILPLGIELFMTQKDIAKKVFLGTANVIMVLGTVICLFYILPGKSTSPSLPSFQTSWVVTIDSLKESPLIGIGPGNYLSAFNLYRPLSYNSTTLWTTRFTSARDFYLTLVAEAGLVGLTGIVLLAVKLLALIRHFKDRRASEVTNAARVSNFAALLILLGSLLFFPASLTLIVTLFVFLALLAHTQKTNINLLSTQQEDVKESQSSWLSKLPILLMTVPVMLLVLLFAFFSGRAIVAENAYYKSLVAASKNDGKSSYDLMRQAISLNPYVDRYHISYAELNLTLANSIAAKKNLAEDERTTISQLIEQSIREGKAAVILNPARSGNWEILGNIYETIIPLAKGADQFAVQTLQQAVALDPLNPALRLSLGGVFYQAKVYDTAIEIFKLAVSTKPDFANAHYNLALAYREHGDLDKAVAEMNNVLSLVDKSSKDYDLAKSTLDDIEKKLPPKQAQSGDTLTAPQNQQNAINPKIDLPADANPPAAESTTTPQASPIPSEQQPSATPGPSSSPR